MVGWSLTVGSSGGRLRVEMRRILRCLRATALFGLLLLLLTACGGDDAGGDSGSIEVHDAWAQPVAVEAAGSSDHDMPMDGSATVDEHASHSSDAMATSGDDSMTGAVGAVYLTIENESGTDDRLLGVSSDVADAVEVHKSELDDKGVMRMNPVDAVEVPDGESVAFESGSYHIMLIGLHDDLTEGESFEIELHLEESGSIPVTVEVREP